MDKKKLIPPTKQPFHHLTIQDLSAELIELSENDLQQLIGGIGIARLTCDGEIAHSYRLGDHPWVRPEDRPRESI